VERVLEFEPVELEQSGGGVGCGEAIRANAGDELGESVDMRGQASAAAQDGFEAAGRGVHAPDDDSATADSESTAVCVVTQTGGFKRSAQRARSASLREFST
jgi:hypothetical protein